MFRALFGKELLEALASRRFWVILALSLVLVPLGVEVSLKDYRTRLQNYREAVRIYREETKLVQDVLYKEGAKAFAPPAPLAFLSLGLELVLPNVAETPAGRIDPPVVMRLGNNDSRDNLYEFFTGPLDLVFVVAVVMSLLAIILTYGAVSGEKEQGTLGQILSNSVPRAKIILAKAAANSLVLILPFLLSVALALTILSLQGGFPAGPGAWASVGLALVVSILLIGVFLNLGLFMSALTRQAVPALVALLLVWTFFFGVYPRLSAAAAQVLYPVKSDAQVALEKSQIKRDIDKACDAEIVAAAQTMPEDFKSEAFKAGQKRQEEIRDRYRAKLEADWDAIDRDLEARRDARNALTANIARVSPVSAFVRPMAELARTGWIESWQFRRLVGQYEQVLDREIYNKLHIIRMPHAVTISNSADPNAPAPVFAYVPAPEDRIVRDILPDLALLLLFNLVLFAAAFVVFLRYDPRQE
jgi:ABC-type transport system involved in multi-copper enzyme maturation permease subunit